jgi:hypothetical protein
MDLDVYTFKTILTLRYTYPTSGQDFVMICHCHKLNSQLPDATLRINDIVSFTIEVM